jgi:hypothetical protein
LNFTAEYKARYVATGVCHDFVGKMLAAGRDVGQTAAGSAHLRGDQLLLE